MIPTATLLLYLQRSLVSFCCMLLVCRHFDVTTLCQLSNLQQLTIDADWAIFWKGPFTKPALYKQLATLLPQLTTLKQLQLKYVVLPEQPHRGLAGLTQLSQLELLSLDHVVPFITPDAAGSLASSLTALTSLAINQCYHSSDAHRCDAHCSSGSSSSSSSSSSTSFIQSPRPAKCPVCLAHPIPDVARCTRPAAPSWIKILLMVLGVLGFCRIMRALQPLLPRLRSLSLPNHRGQTQVACWSCCKGRQCCCCLLLICSTDQG